MLVSFRPSSWGLVLPAFLFVFLIALLFTALGTAIASLLEDMQGFQLIMNFLVMPLFFLSGALFPLQGLPRAIKAISYFDPLSFGVDGLRGTLVNSSVFGLGLDFLVLTILTTLLLAVGSYLFSRIEV
jgi:ABC-2 type transport system permease protein